MYDAFFFSANMQNKIGLQTRTFWLGTKAARCAQKRARSAASIRAAQIGSVVGATTQQNSHGQVADAQRCWTGRSCECEIIKCVDDDPRQQYYRCCPSTMAPSNKTFFSPKRKPNICFTNCTLHAAPNEPPSTSNNCQLCIGNLASQFHTHLMSLWVCSHCVGCDFCCHLCRYPQPTNDPTRVARHRGEHLHSISIFANKTCHSSHLLRQNSNTHIVSVIFEQSNFTQKFFCSCGLSYIGKISPANPIYLSFACGDVS